MPIAKDLPRLSIKMLLIWTALHHKPGQDFVVRQLDLMRSVGGNQETWKKSIEALVSWGILERSTNGAAILRNETLVRLLGEEEAEDAREDAQ